MSEQPGQDAKPQDGNVEQKMKPKKQSKKGRAKEMKEGAMVAELRLQNLNPEKPSITLVRSDKTETDFRCSPLCMGNLLTIFQKAASRDNIVQAWNGFVGQLNVRL